MFHTSGCSGGSLKPAVPIPVAKVQFAYTANLPSSSISGYSLDTSSGALSPLAGFPLATALNPEFVVHEPSNQFLIVTDLAAALVRVFKINSSTGMLSEISPSPYHIEQEPRAMAIDPTGKYVCVGSQSVNCVTAFSIDGSGVLSPIQGSPFSTGGNRSGVGCCVVTDPGVKFLYAEYGGEVYFFAIAKASGALRLVSDVPTPTLGGGLAADPSGRFLYAVGAGTNSIEALALDSNNGTLTPATASPMTLKDGAYPLPIEPSGRYAYTVEARGTLLAYRLQNGVFTNLGDRYAGALGSQQLTIDPTGAFIYGPQTGTENNVSRFRITTSGALSLLPGSPTASGNWPYSVTITSK